ncbi:MAG: SURF1 family protein [Gemmatimonas sp.]
MTIIELSRRRSGIASTIVLLGVVALVAAVVCVRLGMWQLDRLAGRRAQNALIRARGEGVVVSVSEIQGIDTAATHWRRVHVRGTADYRAELVHATRSQNGSPGVHLLTPVRPLDGAWGDTAVLLLRGFLAAADGRTINWEAARESDTLSFDALVTSFPPRRPGNVRMPSSARAVRLLDRDTLAALIGRPLAPFVLLVLGDTVVRDVTLPARIPPPSPGDGPHKSYAFQWFAFALVAVGGFAAFVVTSRKRHDELAE